MRLSNKSKIPLYNFYNTVLLMCIVGGVVLFLLAKYKYHILGWGAYSLLMIPFVFLLFYIVRGRQIFEYDSDGEALNFKNRNILPFMGKNLSDEFPKYKLLKYEVINAFFYKRLYITISSKKSHSLILKYEISYLTNKELADLKYSLSKIIKNNKENLSLGEK